LPTKGTGLYTRPPPLLLLPWVQDFLGVCRREYPPEGLFLQTPPLLLQLWGRDLLSRKQSSQCSPLTCTPNRLLSRYFAKSVTSKKAKGLVPQHLTHGSLFRSCAVAISSNRSEKGCSNPSHRSPLVPSTQNSFGSSRIIIVPAPTTVLHTPGSLFRGWDFSPDPPPPLQFPASTLERGFPGPFEFLEGFLEGKVRTSPPPYCYCS